MKGPMPIINQKEQKEGSKIERKKVFETGRGRGRAFTYTAEVAPSIGLDLLN